MNLGSKPRFPTMRELFGTSLDRFIVNPELRPERSWIVEGGWSHVTDRWQADVVGFLQRTRDTIDQENVIVDGERKRQRINLDGSRVIGVEWQAAAEVTADVDFQGHVTWLRPVAITEGARSGHLTEKPEILATLITRFGPIRGVSLDATGIYTGRAFGLAQDNSLVSLPTAWRLNVRLAAQRFFADSGLFLQTYLGADNVFDALLLPQLGLPDAGRSLRFGVSLAR